MWSMAICQPRLDFKRVNGGLLVQEADLEWLVWMTQRSATSTNKEELQDLLFCWKVAKYAEIERDCLCEK